jgi:beta-lactamase superfamily II metal-dependent hydrolase
LSISIQVLPAKNGDCFLLSYGNGKIHMLIDCGYVHTFTNYLQKELIAIEKAGGTLDHLILTHIDSDHIWGAIALLKTNSTSKFISIGNIWHNTFRHLFNLGDLPDTADAHSDILIKGIIQKGYKKNDSGNGEVSAEQATTVGAYIMDGKYNWNTHFDQKAACIEHGPRIKLDPYADLYLLSPDQSKLKALKSHWEDELLKYDINYSKASAGSYDDAFEMLLSWAQTSQKSRAGEKATTQDDLDTLLSTTIDIDRTPTNGSSIAFILETGGKKLLFLADAHPDLILKSLNEYQPEGVIEFELIKVAHHGSFANNSQELLAKIDSKRYIISTNGAKDSHPDKETIAHIITRKTDFHRELYFNYKTLSAKFFERKDWQKIYNYSINFLDIYPYTLIINE